MPAYAHNDYRNAKPLLDALALGYRGAEADLFRIGTDLVVGHDRGALRGASTLAHLYLQPLRERRRACGYVLSDTTPFFLNIELKEADPRAFQYLLSQLREFEELFISPQPGVGPAVQVTLVGWWPSRETVASWPRYLRVQLAVERLDEIPVIDSAFVGLVSIDYEKFLKWDGRGGMPPEAAQRTLGTARDLATKLRAALRVHHVPVDASVYRWLLANGVTLIGTTDLKLTRSLLSTRPL